MVLRLLLECFGCQNRHNPHQVLPDGQGMWRSTSLYAACGLFCLVLQSKKKPWDCSCAFSSGYASLTVARSALSRDTSWLPDQSPTCCSVLGLLVGASAAAPESGCGSILCTLYKSACGSSEMMNFSRDRSSPKSETLQQSFLWIFRAPFCNGSCDGKASSTPDGSQRSCWHVGAAVDSPVDNCHVLCLNSG